MQAKSSILVGGVSWLNEYMSFVVDQRGLGRILPIPREDGFDRRERTSTHCVAHKSNSLVNQRKKKQRINIYQ
jgi:hypothetical protein